MNAVDPTIQYPTWATSGASHKWLKEYLAEILTAYEEPREGRFPSLLLLVAQELYRMETEPTRAARLTLECFLAVGRLTKIRPPTVELDTAGDKA